MADEIFPDLPGLEIDVFHTPMWKTLVEEAVSGKELRAALTMYPRWQIRVSYSVLRSGAEAEFQAVVGFFNRHRGRWKSFLLLDPKASAETDCIFGVGDGTTRDFQLVRNLGGFVEPVQDVKGTPTIKKDAAVQASPGDYSINASGLVSFVTAPGDGAALTWSGEYYTRVRFQKDEIELHEFLRHLYELKRLDLITDKR